MTETFVDLTYRGLSLGRRIKLTQVRAASGYLEHPTPMPVGTALAIATDDGLVFDAVVEAIHEQVGGSETPPGMLVKPALSSEQLAGWWTQRVQPDAPAAAPVAAPAEPERAKPVTVRPRSHTIPEPNAAAALASAGPATFTSAVDGYAPTPHAPTAAVALPQHTIPGTVAMPPPGAELPIMTTIPGTVFNPAPEAGGRSTTVMNAVDQELLAQLTKNDDIETITRRSGEHAIIDDGMRTSVMDAVDPAALGLIVTDEDDDDSSEPSAAESGPIGAQPDDKKPKGGGAVKKRKKRR